MRIGYSFWGYLGDYKYDRQGNPVSTPDGNATYGWSIVASAMERGHKVFPMQENRDSRGFTKHGIDLFASFSKWKRYAAYLHLCHNDYENSSSAMGSFPELDVLLIEWRFPIPGRNTRDDVGKPGFQQDLLRQEELINHYLGTKTKVIYWDLDGKLDDVWMVNNHQNWEPDAIFETAMKPSVKLWTNCWHQVEPPFMMSDVFQKGTKLPKPEKKMAYIGSRYERDDVIEQWIKPVSELDPHTIQFHGKWDDEAKKMWPKISFFDRCTVSDFHRIYSDAGCVPLLAKRSYMENGFITPRPWEALLFGSLPVGLHGHLGVEKYVNDNFVATSPTDLWVLAKSINGASSLQRMGFREDLAHKLQFMDASFFVKKIEDVVG